MFAGNLIVEIFNGQKMTLREDVLLHLDDVGKTYQMGEVAVEVLKHIDLQIFHSELLVLVGPSGSGKTTMLNLIGGLDTPTVGHVWYGQRDISVAGPRIDSLSPGNYRFCFSILQFGSKSYRART